MSLKKEKNEKDFSNMEMEYEINQEDYGVKVYTMEELLEDSKKSKKYIGKISIESYLTDMKKTILTMNLTNEICQCIIKEAIKAGIDADEVQRICNTIKESTEEEYTEETINKLENIRKKISKENIEEIIKQIYYILDNNYY